MSKHTEWWDSLDPQTKEYLKHQPIWSDRDLLRASIVGGVVGFIIGVLVGYEWAWRPVVGVFRPLFG